MARGGYRENSGRKTTWASGRGFDDTKTIRIPKAFADELTEIAHKLDAGEAIGLDTESFNVLIEENSRIREDAQKLQCELERCRQELHRKKEYSRQLDLDLITQSSDRIPEELIDQVLNSLKLGTQSPGYKSAKKACKKLIDLLKDNFEIVSKS
jgi:hypothetical protein